MIRLVRASRISQPRQPFSPKSFQSLKSQTSFFSPTSFPPTTFSQLHKQPVSTMANLNTSVPNLKLNDGTLIPMLAYGTGTAMYKSASESTSIDPTRVEQIKTAIKCGYYHLDGAEVYGTEAELGKAIKDSGVAREKLFVTTKVLPHIADIPKALDESLKKLGLEYVDLYLIHAPWFDNKPLGEAWAEMEAVHSSGKARSIGVSNFLIPHMETLLKTAKIKPSINQTEFHMYLQRRELVDWHKEHDIPLGAYGPVTPATKAAPGPVDDVLSGLAKKYAVGEAEICLRWVMDKGAVVVTTSSKEQRLSDFMRVTAFKLTPREVLDLDERGAEKHFRGFWTHKFGEDDRT